MTEKGETLNSKIFGFLKPLAFSFKYISAKKWIFIGLLTAAVITTVTRLLIPIYIGDSVSAIEGHNLSQTVSFSLLIIYVSIGAGITRFAVNYSAQYLAQTYAYNLRGDVFSHILNKKFTFYENQTSGDLLSRSTLDIRASMNFILSTMSQLIPTILLIIVAIYFLFTIQPTYALTFFFAVPVLLYAGIVFQRKQRVHWRNIRSNYGRMNEELQENIIGQRVIRGFSAENQEIGKFTGTTSGYFNEYMEIARLRGFYINIMPFVVSAAATTILLYGGYMTLISASDVGPLVSVINIFTMMSFPVSFLGRLIVFSENARASIERISVILNSEGEEDFSYGNTIPEGSELTFKDVFFRRGRKKILDNINLKVSKGEVVGIAGKTAAGKSTLVNLIPRFYDPDSGTVEINNVDIKDIPLAELRRKVSLVPQEINILSGTLIDNIAFGNGLVDLDKARKAASIAQISDFIETLPDSYNSVVGERGITLSGGQKQRVGVARALYSTPEILILDDATASVDPKTELEMLQAIKKEMAETTIMMVTHRESALKFCDRVVRVQDGMLLAREDLGTGLEQNSEQIEIGRHGGPESAADV